MTGTGGMHEVNTLREQMDRRILVPTLSPGTCMAQLRRFVENVDIIIAKYTTNSWAIRRMAAAAGDSAVDSGCSPLALRT